MRTRTTLTPEEQWDLTAALAGKLFEPGEYALVNQLPGYPIYRERPLPGILLLCRAQRTTRFFLTGDLFVATYHANDSRQPVWGVSSRGYHLRYYWTDLFRRWQRNAGTNPSLTYESNRSRLQWVELPGELVGKHPIDPDVRSFVIETLRAGDSDGAVRAHNLAAGEQQGVRGHRDAGAGICRPAQIRLTLVGPQPPNTFAKPGRETKGAWHVRL